ncbi:hypothetical protein NQ315_003891 [Exocentrus adspersus]|uniref:Insulin-like domain-containing protein n=1 Tax=Exocentrus adspersus TaxID=1586481 RepID=A0AAV8VY48_9CUCU|nr:hypothetical protein NQ315_003891 [Exocentrus adspersus]
MEIVHSLFIATILLGLTDGQSDIGETFRTKKYCGSHLSQALSAICKGNYNSLFKKQEVYQKKSYWDPQYPSGMPQDGQAFPFQSRSQATSVMSNYRRRRRQIHGVYNECCEKSCSREELSAYCAPPYKRRR